MSDLSKELRPTFIDAELKKFNITDAAIAELKELYLPLKINGLEDKDGYKKVYDALQKVKNTRIDIEKRGKGMRAEATRFNKAVLNEEHRIVELLNPIEDHLTKEREKVDNEKKRIKDEEERAEELRNQNRTKKLFDLGMSFNGEKYTLGDLALHQMQIPIYSDEQYDAFVLKVEAEIELEKEKKAAEDLKKKEAQAELDKIAKEQQAEKLRLDAIAKENEAIKAALKKQQDDLDKQKKEAEEIKFKSRLAILSTLGMISNGFEFSYTVGGSLAVAESYISRLSDENFISYIDELKPKIQVLKNELAEKQRKELEEANRKLVEKTKKDAEDKTLKDKAESERLEQLKPDKEKLQKFSKMLSDIVGPVLLSKEANDIVTVSILKTKEIGNYIITEIEKLK